MTADSETEAPLLHDLSAVQALALGDAHAVEENFAAAVDAYAAAESVVRETEHRLRFRILAHRSAAFYQLGRYQDALADAQEAGKLLVSVPIGGLREGESEACSRREGLAAFRVGNYEHARKVLKAAQQVAELNQKSTLVYDDWIRQCNDKLEPTTTPETVPKPSASKAAPKAAPAPAPAAAPVPEPPAANSRPKVPKYQYYQSDKIMTVAILEPSVMAENLRVDFGEKRLTVVLTKQGVELTVIAGDLYETVDVERCRVNIRDEKVLIKLRKNDAFEWPELFAKRKINESSSATKATTTEAAAPEKETTTKEIPKVPTDKPRPYTSHRDWDKIEKEVEKEAEDQEADPAAALFKMIYANADEDTRRAMIKSYQTSGGTVLSTNWSEVAKKDYEKERTAPKGQEWKTWEGDKLPTKDDD